MAGFTTILAGMTERKKKKRKTKKGREQGFRNARIEKNRLCEWASKRDEALDRPENRVSVGQRKRWIREKRKKRRPGGNDG